jgi:LysM repeat protein
MKSWKAIVFFLLLNIIVSACTTLAVLYYWDSTRSNAADKLLPKISLNRANPSATSPSTTAETQPTATQAFIVYVVQEGDEFTSIAEEYGVNVDELIALNGFSQNQPLGVGEILRIPVAPTPVPMGSVEIKSVVGAGDLNTERVVIKFIGEGKLSLVGWSLQDENGNTYQFPETSQLTLFTNGAVGVFTKAGANSSIEFFWGLQEPVWESGETVTLIDATGTAQANYLIP